MKPRGILEFHKPQKTKASDNSATKSSAKINNADISFFVQLWTREIIEAL